MKRLVVLVLTAALGGCNFLTFLDFEDDAPIEVLEKPSSFEPGSFGSVLVAMNEDDGSGDRLERLMVGARAATPIYEYVLSEAGAVLPGDDETNRLCDPQGRETDQICADASVGAALSAVDTWDDGVLCVAIGGTGDSAVVACDREKNTQRWTGEVRSGFGISVSAVPGEARILIGSTDERVFLVDEGDTEETALDVSECALSSDGLGTVVAAAPGFWAIGTRGDEVVISGTDGEAAAVLSVVDGGAATLLVADLVGDGTMDLLAGGAGEVRIWDGEGILLATQADNCEDVDDEWITGITCEDFADRGVVCSDTFGASLAVGDVNADDVSELLVGDPQSTVDGEERAGAVHVFSVEDDDGDVTVERGDVLIDSFPEVDDELGRAVAVASILGRGEVIAGSDGEVFVFFCTDLEGDRPGDEDLDDSCRLNR